MEITATKKWQKIANKGQQVSLQNRGLFAVEIFTEQENDSHSKQEDGWAVYPNSPPTELHDGAVWVRSVSGLDVKVVYQIKN